MAARYGEAPLASTGARQSIAPTTATGLTVPKDTELLVITVDANPVRWSDDGTDPTASSGMYLAANTVMTYTGPASSLKFIDTAAGASKVSVSYYKFK